jgi:hypothetical protein
MALPCLPSENDENIDQSEQINIFCEKLCTFKEIIATKEVGAFLSNQPDIKSTLNTIEQESIQEISTKYSKLYTINDDNEFNLPKAQEKTRLFKFKLDKTYTGIKGFKKIVQLAMQNYQIEHNEKISILKYLLFHERETISNFNNNNPDLLVLTKTDNEIQKLDSNNINPYINLYKSSLNEELDTQALVEALDSLQDIYDKYEEHLTRLSEIEIKIQNHANNKWKFLSYLTLRTPQMELNDLKDEKTLIEYELESMRIIIRFSLLNLDQLIEIFKNDRLEEYYKELQEISQINIANAVLYDNFLDKIDAHDYIQQINNKK